MTIDKATYTNITPDGEEICEVPLLTAEEKSRAVKDYCISIESDCNKCPISKYTKCFNENCYTLDSEKFPCDINRNYELVFGKTKINFVKVERNDEVEPTNDAVQHPSHYTQGGIECIEAIRASMTADGFCDYCKGNIIKYIWRWRDKGGAEDLRKASVYLNWLINAAEGKESRADNG